MRPHLVLNRNARELRGPSPVLDALRRAAASTCTVHETSSLAELALAAARIVAEAPDAVILAGGDGAYMAGLSALHRAARGAPLPAIALAPGGTVSTVARNFGMRGALPSYASRLVGAVVHGSTLERETQTLLITEESGACRVGFIFGTGLVVRFFDLYASEPRPGYAAAARIVRRVFVGSFTGGALAKHVLTPIPARLSVDGVQQPSHAYSLLVASVVRDLGLHMRVTYRAQTDPRRLHLVASPLSARELGPQLPLVLAGQKLWGARNVDRLVESFHVEFTGTRRAYVLDGDVFESASARVEVGPRVRLLTLR